MAHARGDGGADWEKLALGWERGRRVLWEATRPVSEWLVERLGPAPGETILELAAGTGETGFLAAPFLQPGGRLISSDRSAKMLAARRRLAADLTLENVEFRILDTGRIELPSASLDGVLSRFGYVLRGDPPAALGEVRRVVRPGGRFAFAVWAARERNSWITVPAEVMAERGHIAGPSAAEIRISERRNPGAVEDLLAPLGFTIEAIDELPVRYRFADAAELWRFVSELRGPLSLVVGRLEPREQALVRAAIEERARSAEGSGYELAGVSLNVLANVASAGRSSSA